MFFALELFTASVDLSQVLMELSAQSFEGLVEPRQLFQLCQLAGFVPDSQVTDNPAEQRARVLTVALENQLLGLLTGCVREWKDGRYALSGCDLRFIMEWAWSQVTATKELMDR